MKTSPNPIYSDIVLGRRPNDKEFYVDSEKDEKILEVYQRFLKANTPFQEKQFIVARYAVVHVNPTKAKKFIDSLSITVSKDWYQNSGTTSIQRWICFLPDRDVSESNSSQKIEDLQFSGSYHFGIYDQAETCGDLEYSPLSGNLESINQEIRLAIQKRLVERNSRNWSDKRVWKVQIEIFTHTTSFPKESPFLDIVNAKAEGKEVEGKEKEEKRMSFLSVLVEFLFGITNRLR